MKYTFPTGSLSIMYTAPLAMLSEVARNAEVSQEPRDRSLTGASESVGAGGDDSLASQPIRFHEFDRTVPCLDFGTTRADADSDYVLGEYELNVL
jgi:hypothetical protein